MYFKIVVCTDNNLQYVYTFVKEYSIHTMYTFYYIVHRYAQCNICHVY